MKYDMNNASSSNINIRNSIWKKAIRVGTMVLVPIPEPIVKRLHLDVEHIWFDLVPVRGGIFLKIASKKIECERQRGQEKPLTKGESNMGQTFPGSRILAEVF